MDTLTWGHDTLSLDITWDDHTAPQLAGLAAGGVRVELPTGCPLVQVLTVDDGHVLASDRLVASSLGARMRYVRHTVTEADGRTRLELEVHDAATGVTGILELTSPYAVAALRARVTVRNDGTEALVLRSVASWSAYVGATGTAAERSGWSLHRARNDWLGEGRWSVEPLDALRLPDLGHRFTGPTNTPRGHVEVVSTGTWSTGRHLPVAALVEADRPLAWAWQVEHNGGWRFEVGEDGPDLYLALSGPTDIDHQWNDVLAPGEQFTTVPVGVTLAESFTAAIAQLTAYRRAVRRPHPDNTALPVVFNDYMNTLMADPTTDKLLPLIDAAAAVGADVFCIDAGWYDDLGHWWDSVGEWAPSTTRFRGGLIEIIDHIRDRGLTPGLWLEPEVVGVRSPVAARLPAAAYLQRGGRRVVEHQRYHLDLRHPAARAHLDEVVDRLVADFGIGFFKLDYNINPGAGTDHDADSVGDGLLQHNRAHLDWLDGVLDRHPALVLENCGSGAMRSDFAMLSRLQLQSTSDQQDPLRYPVIAAAAPAAMLPEQAASWAYPQPAMSPEEMAFTLVTGLTGRIYLSGHLDQMSADQLDLVREGVRAARDLAPALRTAVPFWPLGLPAWDAEVVALGLDSPVGRYLAVWDRVGGAVVDLPLPDAARGTPVFPTDLAPWPAEWVDASGVLRVGNGTAGPAARLFRLDPVAVRA